MLFFFCCIDSSTIMLFLIGFVWHVAASFAFLLAILTPNWVTVTTVPSAGNVTLQRGIFYVCDLVSKNATHETARCASIIDLDPSINSTVRWNYSKYLTYYFILNYSYNINRSCHLISITRNCCCWT